MTGIFGARGGGGFEVHRVAAAALVAAVRLMRQPVVLLAVVEAVAVVAAACSAASVAPTASCAAKKPGDKLFSDLFTLKSDIGNQVLRQSTIGPDNKPAAPVTWVENGVLRTLGAGAAASTNQSLVQEGSNLSVEEMIKQTRRGLLVTSFWYIRGVPSQEQPLLNTGMTRDGLFLIENGEIVGPVQNSAGTCLRSLATTTSRSWGSPCRCCSASLSTAARRRSYRRCASKSST